MGFNSGFKGLSTYFNLILLEPNRSKTFK